MARPEDDRLWALAHAERAPLADDLADLSAGQWRHATPAETLARFRSGLPNLRSRLPAGAP